MKTSGALVLMLLICCSLQAQNFYAHSKAADKWVNRTFKKMSKRDRIAQLMIVRAHSNLGAEHVQAVTQLVQQYHVGGLCFFQGGPVRQAVLTNYYQSIAQTPLMICMDGEWGLGMRLDSVIPFPRQLLMGAISDNAPIIYQFGKAVGEQCKRMGIQVNYAPVVDINNNPENPVINDRSFGEDKYKVALYGTAFMQGMQDQNIMACAKHFPGHGDVTVDSHKDLPVIHKSMAQLDSLELYPFKALIKAGVGSVMMGHLFVPAIDSTEYVATSISKNAVTGLLKNKLGFQGITFTDALEMQGIAKYFPAGEAALQSLIAGNDLLCLPGDVPGSIDLILKAIKLKKLNRKDINARVKKVLLVKYNMGLAQRTPIDTTNLANDLNKHTAALNATLTEQALTLLRLTNTALQPLQQRKKIAYISIGANGMPIIAQQLQTNYGAKYYAFANKQTLGKEVMDNLNSSIPQAKSDKAAANTLINAIKEGNYDEIIVGLHNFSRRPAHHFGIDGASLYLLKQLQQLPQSIVCIFGNPYAIANVCMAPNLVACNEDTYDTQTATYHWLTGTLTAKGTLPVTVCNTLPYGTGLQYNTWFPKIKPEVVGMNSTILQQIDSIAQQGVDKGAYPGCQVLAARNGKVVYHKAFGYTNFDKQIPVNLQTAYDLASVTKVSATTVAIMKLVDEGKVDIHKTLGHYLPIVRGTDKAGLVLKDILLHQAGLVPFISFYKEVINPVTGMPLPQYFSTQHDADHRVRVAENLYLRNDWEDTILHRIMQSKLLPHGHYVYSDNDFILLAKVVEAVTGQRLDEYVAEQFYRPLQMTSTTFLPREKIPLDEIAPTEVETHFRNQLMWGDVHDEGAAMLGGVAGHAGLFSDAYDLAQLYQMLLNKGVMNGKRYLSEQVIDEFTAYNSAESRRGLGFDKPEKNNATANDPYPCKDASPLTFGHTGFTGTCVWVDPKENLVYIFLSNHVNPTRNNNLLFSLHIRPNIQEVLYHAVEK
ncbi:MAG: serine hydrolase [Sphingobacteriales bacterium]|nr:MAG: serine hydrolase [Sphingobacteriales bacterium]